MKIYFWECLAWSQPRFAERFPCFPLAALLQGQILRSAAACRGTSGAFCCFSYCSSDANSLSRYLQVGHTPLDVVSVAGAPAARSCANLSSQPGHRSTFCQLARSQQLLLVKPPQGSAARDGKARFRTLHPSCSPGHSFPPAPTRFRAGHLAL